MSRRGEQSRKRLAMKRMAKEWTPFTEVAITDELRNGHPHMKNVFKIYGNSRFEVHLYNCTSPIGGIVQMVVSRHGNLDQIRWDELVRIKNELFDVSTVALEVYPPENVVNWNSSLRFLWIMPEGYQLPFGLHLDTAWGGK